MSAAPHSEPQTLVAYRIVADITVGELNASPVFNRTEFTVRAADKMEAYNQAQQLVRRILDAFGPTDPANAPWSIGILVREK